MSNANESQPGAEKSELSPDEIRQALASLELAMRMLGKAVHRFSQLQAVHNELRYDPMWTDFEVQLQQALGNVKKIVK